MGLPVLSRQDKRDLAGHISARTLETKRDLFPLITYLAEDCPHTILLTPTAYLPRQDNGTPAESLKARIKFRMACGAMNESLMRGELPTSPVVKFPPELLNPGSEHELALRYAATLMALRASDKCVVYYDMGIDDDMLYFMRAARAARVPIELRCLDLPGVISRLPVTTTRRTQAEESLAAVMKEKAAWLKSVFHCCAESLSDGVRAGLFDKLKDRSLTLKDRENMAAYFAASKRVVVESPYAPWSYPESGSLEKAFRTIDEEANLFYALHCLRTRFLEGHYAAASHAEFTYPGILNDTIEHERTLGIAAGLAKTCGWELSEMNMDRLTSSGMDKGAAFAKMIGREVTYRYHGSDWPWEFSKPEIDFFISALEGPR